MKEKENMREIKKENTRKERKNTRRNRERIYRTGDRVYVHRSDGGEEDRLLGIQERVVVIVLRVSLACRHRGNVVGIVVTAAAVAIGGKHGV